MTNLADWLRAQLDEDERLARAATPGPWRYDPRKAWHLPEDLAARRNGEEFVGAGAANATVGVAATGPADHPQSMVDAEYIAAWDPARVLAEVAAKRQLVDLHAERHECHECLEPYGANDAAGDNPCGTLCLLALPYAGRPGYREEWRP